ncbi:MAG: c-type cytochrome [Nitrospira sp.]|nr:c-type cytochrome [Nitrospira sp.]MDH5252552.1 c-type cytochrome [Nitrospira sp.]
MRKLLLSLLLLTILLIFSGGLWLGYDVYTTGFSAKVEPHRIEVALVRQLRRLAIPNEIRDMPNPVPMSPAVLIESLEHFADHCAICHGNNGSGETRIGKNVFPRVPDLRLEDTQSMSDGELFFMIHNGIRFTAMPAWGEGEMDQDTGSWKLVHFIRHLRQLTPEELDRMKSLIPKPHHDAKGGEHAH